MSLASTRMLAASRSLSRSFARSRSRSSAFLDSGWNRLMLSSLSLSSLSSLSSSLSSLSSSSSSSSSPSSSLSSSSLSSSSRTPSSMLSSTACLPREIEPGVYLIHEKVISDSSSSKNTSGLGSGSGDDGDGDGDGDGDRRARRRGDVVLRILEHEPGHRILQLLEEGEAGDPLTQSFVIKDSPTKLSLSYLGDAMASLVLLPPSYRPPKRILIFGLGGGTALSYLRATHPDAEIDVVEKEADVIDAAHRFLYVPYGTRTRGVGTEREKEKKKKKKKKKTKSNESNEDPLLQIHHTDLLTFVREFNEKNNSSHRFSGSVSSGAEGLSSSSSPSSSSPSSSSPSSSSPSSHYSARDGSSLSDDAKRSNFSFEEHYDVILQDAVPFPASPLLRKPVLEQIRRLLHPVRGGIFVQNVLERYGSGTAAVIAAKTRVGTELKSVYPHVYSICTGDVGFHNTIFACPYPGVLEMEAETDDGVSHGHNNDHVNDHDDAMRECESMEQKEKEKDFQCSGRYHQRDNHHHHHHHHHQQQQQQQQTHSSKNVSPVAAENRSALDVYCSHVKALASSSSSSGSGDACDDAGDNDKGGSADAVVSPKLTSNIVGNGHPLSSDVLCDRGVFLVESNRMTLDVLAHCCDIEYVK